MKKKLLAVSLVGNVALLAGLLWARAEHEAEMRDYTQSMMSADEQYLGLLARSLEAIESAEPDEARATADLLRVFVEGGNRNIEARREAGLRPAGR